MSSFQCIFFNISDFFFFNASPHAPFESHLSLLFCCIGFLVAVTCIYTPTQSRLIKIATVNQRQIFLRYEFGGNRSYIYNTKQKKLRSRKIFVFCSRIFRIMTNVKRALPHMDDNIYKTHITHKALKDFY